MNKNIKNIRIEVPANNGYVGASVLLATIDTESHLNIYFENATGAKEDLFGGTKYVQFTPATARSLRDALIGLYPVDTVTPPLCACGANECDVEIAPADPASPTINVAAGTRIVVNEV